MEGGVKPASGAEEGGVVASAARSFQVKSSVSAAGVVGGVGTGMCKLLIEFLRSPKLRCRLEVVLEPDCPGGGVTKLEGLGGVMNIL